MARKVKNQALAEAIQSVSEGWRQKREAEFDNLFDQCDYLLENDEALRAEFPDESPELIKKEVLKQCGIAGMGSISSMRDRWLVGHIFNGKYARSHDYSLHVVCARAEGVNVDDPATYAIAEKWLQDAEGGYTETKRGKEHWRPHSTRTLKALMKAGKVAKDKPTTLLNKVECQLVRDDLDNEVWRVSLILPEAEFVTLQVNTTYLITLTSPAQTPTEIVPESLELPEAA